MHEVFFCSSHRGDSSNTSNVPQANWIPFLMGTPYVLVLSDLHNSSFKDLGATRHSNWTRRDTDTTHGSDMFDCNPSDSFFCQWSHSVAAVALYSKGCLGFRVVANLFAVFLWLRFITWDKRLSVQTSHPVRKLVVSTWNVDSFDAAANSNNKRSHSNHGKKMKHHESIV